MKVSLQISYLSIQKTMSLTTFHTYASKVSEQCIWVEESKRYICISYIYYPNSGEIIYAASVLKTDDELTDEQIYNHETTTTRRFDMRPVMTYIDKYLQYTELIKSIRKEMCQGLGCVGFRMEVPRTGDCDVESLVSDDFISDTSSQCEDKFTVSPDVYRVKDVYSFKYPLVTRENHGKHSYTLRVFYVCYKGLSSNGHAIYGATVYHQGIDSEENYKIPRIDDDSHFETALMRMEKCPIHMIIPNEYKHQFNKKVEHREDLMYSIVDMICEKVKGTYQLRGDRQ